MKKRTLLTPIDLASSTKIGKRAWRKQILPKGSINYKGRKITFDDKYLTDLAESFNNKAFDQVPVVFADPENRHNMDPQRFGGEVTDFAVEKDGLYATVNLSKDAAKVVKDNPKLGVSARIMEGLSKSDGRMFPRAIQHVLLTMDPRVTGMKPWQTVDLSGYNGDENRQVVDLTALTFERETEMPKIGKNKSNASAAETTENPKDQVLDLSTLTDEELDNLLSDEDLEADEDVEDVEDSNPPGEEGDVEEANDDPDEDEDDEDDEDGDLAARKEAAKAEKARRTNLSAKSKNRRTIELAEDAQDGTLRDEVRQMQIDLAEQQWQAERREFVRNGVPPYLLDLAEPLLSSPDAATVDLSNADEPVNATEVVRNILTSVKGMVDLTPEIGHQTDLSEDNDDPTDSMLAAWDTEYGVR